MKKTQRFTTRFLTLFLVFVLPANILLVFYSVYATNVVRNQISQANHEYLKKNMAYLDTWLKEGTNSLYQLVASYSTVFRQKILADSRTDSYRAIQAWNALHQAVNEQELADALFFFGQGADEYLYASRSTLSFAASQKARAAVMSLACNAPSAFSTEKWFIREQQGEWYLVRIIPFHNKSYVGQLLDIGASSVISNALSLSSNFTTVIVDDRHVPCAQTPFNSITLDQFGDGFNGVKKMGIDAQRYLLVSIQSETGSFSLLSYALEKDILQSLPVLQFLSIVVPIVSIVIVPLFLLLVQRYILRPMSKLKQAIERVGEGDLTTQIDISREPSEFVSTDECFNRMVRQIKHLKLQNYEEKLEKRRIELKSLQSQVNPHFFLNSLNIVYQLVQLNKRQEVLAMTSSLIAYFRFMFHASSADYVNLRSELDFTKNYVTIQQIRFKDQLACEFLVPNNLMDCQLPPMTMQAFVENSVKHAQSTQHVLNIKVVAHTEGVDKKQLVITISDNGNGFDEGTLDKLNQGADIRDAKGNHFGIWNVMSRLRLLYGENTCGLSFANLAQGGACVIIRLPNHADREKRNMEC